MQFIPSPRCREATVSLHCVCFSTRPRYLVPNWVHQRLFFFLTLSRVITQRNNKAAAVAAVALESSVILKGFFFSFSFLSVFFRPFVCVCVCLCVSREVRSAWRGNRATSPVFRLAKDEQTHTHIHERETETLNMSCAQSFFSTSSSPCDFVCLWKDETKKFKYSNNNKKKPPLLALLLILFFSSSSSSF